MDRLQMVSTILTALLDRQFSSKEHDEIIRHLASFQDKEVMDKLKKAVEIMETTEDNPKAAERILAL